MLKLLKRGLGPLGMLASLLLLGTPWLLAQDATVHHDHGTPWYWWLAPIGSVTALVFARKFYQWMKEQPAGEEEMIKIAGYVKTGAMAYLYQQYKVVGIVFFVLCVLLAYMAYGLGVQNNYVWFAFLTGGFFSGLSGYLGMRTATDASNRTAFAAKENLNKGLQVAFRSGAVMGLVVVGLGLLDISIWFFVLNSILGMELRETTVVMLSFGMGASTQALFARVGGGIFTKAADVGADLVGKVEAGIPEDDPRNPATIADNVGDNVGDVAGMGADLYESYCGAILATAAIGFAAAHSVGVSEVEWVVLPMIIAGLGNIASIASIYFVRTGEDTSLKSLMAALFRGINLASALTIVAALIGILLCFTGFSDADVAKMGGAGTFGLPKIAWGVFWSITAGLVAGVVIAKGTEYYTSNDYAPCKGIAHHAQTGPATVIIDGIAVGMMSTYIPVVVIVIAIMASFGACGGFSMPIMGLYGIAISAVGMLATLGITLATDAYGPIADNAGGNAQMTNQPPHVRERTDALDALGNTTAATGKGFAIGSAALTALALLAAYLEEVRQGITLLGVGAKEVTDKLLPLNDFGYFIRDVDPGPDLVPRVFMKIPSVVEPVMARVASLDQFVEFYQLNAMNPNLVCGVFLGSMMAFVFCALSMKAVGRAAGSMVMEVRRQFKEIPGIMEGKATPDYARCVAISTQGAQREMILPSLLAIVVPIVTGLLLNISGVMGLLLGGLGTGFVLAVMMANSGGAWDNAKKHIEHGEYGGKGSLPHKAAVVGDTVGDPFKDTAGPSLNILIKLMSMVSIVFSGVTVKYAPEIARWLGMAK